MGAGGCSPVDATFTHTAAGLRPDVQMTPLALPNIQDIIASAISQGIAAGLQQGSGAAPSVAPPIAVPAPVVQRALSPTRS